MKITFDKRPLRKAGIFIVKITKVELKSKDNVQWFSLKLENESNYLESRIYTNKSYIVMDVVFNSVCLKRSIFNDNINSLVGKKLSICVREISKLDNKLGIVLQYFNVVRYRNKNFDWSSLESEVIVEEDSASLEEVFGVDREELARQMGKDPSEISDSDYWDYAGY